MHERALVLALPHPVVPMVMRRRLVAEARRGGSMARVVGAWRMQAHATMGVYR